MFGGFPFAGAPFAGGTAYAWTVGLSTGTQVATTASSGRVERIPSVTASEEN